MRRLGKQTKHNHNAIRIVAGVHAQFPPSVAISGHPATALLCMDEQKRSPVEARLGMRSEQPKAIRLNANDPSACTALASGHILGTAAFQRRLEGMGNSRGRESKSV